MVLVFCANYATAHLVSILAASAFSSSVLLGSIERCLQLACTRKQHLLQLETHPQLLHCDIASHIYA